jgi:uncharacterized membrane protein
VTLRTSLSTQILLTLSMIVWTLWRVSTMPDTVPVHWGINGQADRFGSKWESALIMPIIMITMIGLTVILPAISPKNFEIERFRSTYAYIMLLCNIMMSAMHILILEASAGSKVDIGRFIVAIIFAFFALLGNVMGKVRQNFYIGIRTPWTLSNERVWDESHRRAGRLWFFGGIAGAILALVGLPVPGSIALLIIMSFVPIIDSYLISKRIGA